MDEIDRVERHAVLDASVPEVWAALTEARRLSAWIGGDVELDLRPGGRGLARREDGAVRRIRVEVVEPPRRLAFRWWPYEREGAPPGMGTRVEFVLERLAAGTTRLTVTESGWPGFPARPWADARAGVSA
ncbi:MAG: SRPBCC domain-containing protein [Actinomycetota bacterium]|nr:SRPBCC domain-containing protein [Actinomycetota bacterium]